MEERWRRALTHRCAAVFQSSSGDSSTCGRHEEGYRLEITSTMTRLDYFHGQFSDVLLTSIAVFSMGEETVASLGTSTGRVIQVRGRVPPSLYSTLPFSTLLYPTLLYPTLPYPTLPCLLYPTLPYVWCEQRSPSGRSSAPRREARRATARDSCRK